MFSEINGQPLMQHGPYGAALLDFTAPPTAAVAASAASVSSSSHHQSPSSLPITPVSPVSPPYHPHPPHPLSTISQTERLLIQENLLLRQSCQQLMVQVDQLNRNRDYLNTQFTTFHLLYVQQKQDRARLARQLTSTQRELEHLKRAQVLANSVALGHHPIESGTLPMPTRRRQQQQQQHHHHHLHHHQFSNNNNNGNGHNHNHHHLFYRSLKVNGNPRNNGLNGRGGPGNRSWRRTQSAKYYGSGGGGSSTSTIDQQQESAAAQARPTRSKVNASKALTIGKLNSSTYRRYDELNEEDHKTPVMSPSAMATNSPPVFPAGFTNDGQQMTFVQCEIPSIVSDADAVQVHGQDQTQAQQQQQPIPCSSDDDGEIDGSSGSGGDGPEEEGSSKKKKSTKLVYRDSLQQCVEFSRSLLDLSRRHIVGAEKDELENDNDAADGDDHNEGYLQDEAKNNGEVSDHHSQKAETETATAAFNSNDCSNLLTDFLLTYEALEHQKEKELGQKQVEAIVPIEEAIPMIDEPVEPQCCQFLQIECAPITFTSTATQSPQSPPELSSSPVDTTTSTTANSNNNNLVVNLSYVSDDLPATYLREVRLPNKPARQFLGIFFEGAFSSGVVVQQVVPGSVAARAGISPGDRVLEICGINMRTANYRLASRVLAQCETDTVCFKIVSSEAAHRGFPQRTDGPPQQQQQQFRSAAAAAAVAGYTQSDHNEMAEMTHSNTADHQNHHHQFLLLCSQASTSSSGTSATSATSSSSTGSAGSCDQHGSGGDDHHGQLIPSFSSFSRGLRKTCTLTRREAFKNKQRMHSYFERRHGKEAMLYQMTALTVELPRRITVTAPLAKIKLLGGNAVGIFVHSIGDEGLGRLLRTGDQLLAYNNFDLRRATAEDAARELAKPASRSTGGASVLVAMFNLESMRSLIELLLCYKFSIFSPFICSVQPNSGAAHRRLFLRTCPVQSVVAKKLAGV